MHQRVGGDGRVIGAQVGIGGQGKDAAQRAKITLGQVAFLHVQLARRIAEAEIVDLPVGQVQLAEHIAVFHGQADLAPMQRQVGCQQDGISLAQLVAVLGGAVHQGYRPVDVIAGLVLVDKGDREHHRQKVAAFFDGGLEFFVNHVRRGGRSQQLRLQPDRATFTAIARLGQQADDLGAGLGAARQVVGQHHGQIQRGGDAVVQIDPAHQFQRQIALGGVGGQREFQLAEVFQRLVRPIGAVGPQALGVIGGQRRGLHPFQIVRQRLRVAQQRLGLQLRQQFGLFERIEGDHVIGRQVHRLGLGRGVIGAP